jgi:hypothetical protein
MAACGIVCLCTNTRELSVKLEGHAGVAAGQGLSAEYKGHAGVAVAVYEQGLQAELEVDGAETTRPEEVERDRS